MKHLLLRNTTYKNLEYGFTNWLETLGYARSTVDGSPSYIKAFFYYLEQKGIYILTEITSQIIKDYFVYLSRRKNYNKAGSLSLNSLRNNLSALKRFGKYLRETEQGNLEVEMHLPVNKYPSKEILTQKEIKELYYATDQTILGMRDKAMLSIYYGCGLRRNEAVNLNVEDILLEKNKLIVRKGKGYKERIVPITEKIKDDLESYLKYARIDLIERNPQEKAFFVGSRGNRISGNMLYERLRQLREKAGIIKGIGLHTLRHSIATHLLQDGMDIEFVSQFLGHSSLESTQIYTHIANEVA